MFNEVKAYKKYAKFLGHPDAQTDAWTFKKHSASGHTTLGGDTQTSTSRAEWLIGCEYEVSVNQRPHSHTQPKTGVLDCSLSGVIARTIRGYIDDKLKSGLSASRFFCVCVWKPWNRTTK